MNNKEKLDLTLNDINIAITPVIEFALSQTIPVLEKRFSWIAADYETAFSEEKKDPFQWQNESHFASLFDIIDSMLNKNQFDK